MVYTKKSRHISPLTYTAFIGMFPYNKNGFSAKLRNRVIICNIFYFSMSSSCRFLRIILFKSDWSSNIFEFFRIFVYLSIQTVQLVFFGFHLNAMFKNREVLERATRASTIVPGFFKAVIYVEVVYTVSLCLLFVYRCLSLNMYFGIWNTCSVTIQNHFSFQITMLFTFFVYNITKRHEILTRRLASAHISQVSKCLEHHCKLMKRIERLNRVFARPLVFMYGDIFISLAYYTYYMTTLNYLGDDQVISYVLNSLLLSGRFTMLFSTSFIAERLMASANKFNMTLFVKMKNDKDLYTNKILRLYIILQKPVRLSACGFFELGNKLVTSMATAVLTYLVALIQLSDE